MTGPTGSAGIGYSAPLITSVTPSSGSTTGGTAVTLRGSGFQTVSRVSFGALPAASVTAISPTQLNAIAPAAAAGAVDVQVTNIDFTTSKLPAGFTYQAPPPPPASPGLWLRADSITGATDGAALTAWSDSSGQGADVSGSAIYLAHAINGLPAVRFNNGQSLVGGDQASLHGNAISFVAAVRIPANTGGSILWDKLNAYSAIGYRVELRADTGSSATFLWATYKDAGFGSVTGTATPIGAFTSLIGVADSSTSTLITGGASAQVTQTGNVQVDSTPLSIGCRATGTASCANSDIAELIIYARALSPSEIAQAQAYLSAKYGL